MANKKLTLNPGRQYPLVATQAFTFENVSESGVAVVLAKLALSKQQLQRATGFIAKDVAKLKQG